MQNMYDMQIEYDRKVLLGQGGYGSVFLGKYKGVKVAVKRVQLHNVNDNEEKALQCLHQFGHPNIVQLIYSELVTDFKLFALEFCAASLDQLFLNPQNYDGFKLPHHLTVFRQLASGLAFIHSNGLFHRDIKPQNVLISIDSFTELVTIKWADFGLSKFVNERGTCTLSGIKGTDDYFAPELLRSQGKSEGPGRGTIKSDVFSFALVIGYLLLDGQHLYGANYDIPVNIMNKSPVNMGKIDRSHFARDLLDLLTKMLEDDPNKRISSIQVVNELETIKIEVVKKEEEFRELCKKTDLDLNQIQLLIHNGIDVNAKDRDGQNALHLLCLYNSCEKLVDAIELLIKNGIDVKGKDNYGRNALHWLCWNYSSEKLVDAMEFLIQNGIDVNEKDNDGKNALYWLCRFNSSEKIIDAMQFLIKNRIDVNGMNTRSLLCENHNINAETIKKIVLLLQNRNSASANLKASKKKVPAGGKKKSKEPKPRKASYHYQVIECDFCPMRYYTWSAFYFHRCTHTGETPVIPCSVCEMEFPNIKALKEHKIMEHREAIFPCEGCNRTFLSKSALLLHQPIHSNDFNYQCRSCPEKMRTFRERYVHERTHSTTEEPQTPQQKLVL